MAKIKFNLNFGDEQIRTLDDLRDNFSIEDVLDVYNNGLLVKWLDVHNHKHELEQVNAIHATDTRDILTELIRIFGISDDPEEIQDSLSVLDYLEERKKAHEDMKAHGIPDYEKVKKERDELARQIEEMKEAQETETSEPEVHEETPKLSKKTYEELVQEIIDHHQDLSHIYDCLDAITANYPDILKEKYSELFETLHTQRPLTLYALFAHHSTRPYYALNDKQIINKGMGHAVSDYPFFDCPYHRSFDYCLNRSLNAWKLTGHYESYVEREEAKKIPSIVFEKVRFANTLWGITKKTFDDCNGEITDIRHPFLKVFSEIPSSSYEKTQPDSYYNVFGHYCGTMKIFTMQPTSKNFMLFYCLDDDFAFTLPYSKPDSKTGNIRSIALSLVLPVYKGVDGVKVLQEMSQQSSNAVRFCYMEAR